MPQAVSAATAMHLPRDRSIWDPHLLARGCFWQWGAYLRMCVWRVARYSEYTTRIFGLVLFSRVPWKQAQCGRAEGQLLLAETMQTRIVALLWHFERGVSFSQSVLQNQSVASERGPAQVYADVLGLGEELLAVAPALRSNSGPRSKDTPLRF